MQLARSFKNRKNDTWFHCHKHIWRFQESTLEKQKNKKTLSFFQKNSYIQIVGQSIMFTENLCAVFRMSCVFKQNLIIILFIYFFFPHSLPSTLFVSK